MLSLLPSLSPSLLPASDSGGDGAGCWRCGAAGCCGIAGCGARADSSITAILKLPKVGSGDSTSMVLSSALRRLRSDGGRRRREALKGEEVQAGRRGDKRGRWALEELLEVRRVRGRGRGLEVRVRWSGGDATGRSWEDSWVGVTWLTHDLRREAREMEVELY